MSIEVTRLSAAEGTNLQIIKDWFDLYASDLFDSTEVSENALLLKRSGNTAVSVAYNSTAGSYTINLYINPNSTRSSSSPSNVYISRLARTPNGIALGLTITSTSADIPYGFFASETVEGKLGVILASQFASNMMSGGFYIESIGGSRRTSTTALPVTVLADSVTTLTPCICEGADGEYMPDCFITTFSQYKNLECTFTADGNEYLYNGFIAMR